MIVSSIETLVHAKLQVGETYEESYLL